MRAKAWVLFFLSYSSLTYPLQADGPQKKEASIVLTAVENGRELQEEFVCYGKIHGYIRLPQRESNGHSLASRWISPVGKVVADSQTTVDFKPARSTAYVWFAFPENANLLGSPDPDLEQDRMSYNGVWHLDVRWDETLLLQKTFNVRCP